MQRRSHLPTVFVVATCAALLLGQAWIASAEASSRPECPVGVSPYGLSSEALAACGDHLLPRRSTTTLPGGGYQANYTESNGTETSVTVPPPSFDAATASPAELRLYGIPPEPAADSPEYPKWKQMIDGPMYWAPAPKALVEVPPVSRRETESSSPDSGGQTPESPSSATTGSDSRWSGYMDWNGGGCSGICSPIYTHSTGYFIEPASNNTTPGCTEVASYTWAGIGGWHANASTLAQDGTGQQAPNLGPDEAFYEVIHPNEGGGGTIATKFHASPGHYFIADTEYTGSNKYSFYMYNYETHQPFRTTATGALWGKTTEFIIERPREHNLYNFKSVTFQGFTNGKAFRQYPNERIDMQSGVFVKEQGFLNAAAPTNIINNYQFNDVFHICTKATEKTIEEELEGAGKGGKLPHAVTEGSSELTGTTVKLSGSVDPEGTYTTYHFEYGTEAENYSAATPENSAGEGSISVPVSVAVAGLQPGTTYHYRITANSAEGTAVGTDATFKTSGTPPPPPPTVTTEGASGLGAHKATLEGKVNPNGLDTHYYFEYSPNTGLYEKDAPALPGSDAGSGSVPVHVGVGVTELAPYTTYYYRLVASNSTGTSYGAEKEFTTAATGTFSAGAYHTCALVSAGGSIDCWGENYYGQLGNGTNKNNSTKPVAVSGITTAIEVGAGGEHTCALLTVGKSDCWGYNKFGEPGNGTTKASTTPVEVSGISTAIEVSAGYAHTCALLSSGKIDCWGENAYEQLGDGKTQNSSTPVEVSGISTATSVTAGGFGTCATLSGGTVDCWGYGEFGELGNGKTENSSTPVKVSGISNAVAVAAVGYFQACAQLSSGTIDCWGDNEDGELGNGTTTNSSTPVAVSGITTGAGVAAGAFHTCGLLATKSLDCWGENYFGELGNGTTTNSSTPVAVSGITTAAGIIAGTYHTCGRLVGGSVKCWGENAFGQLGNGTTTNSTTPVEVSGLP